MHFKRGILLICAVLLFLLPSYIFCDQSVKKNSDSGGYTITVTKTTTSTTHHDADGNQQGSDGKPITPSHSEYDHSEEHKETRTYKLQVPNSKSPEEIDELTAEMSAGTNIEIKLTRVESVPDALTAGEAETTEILENVCSFKEDIMSQLDLSAELSTFEEARANPSLVGDPVRIPTGEFVTAETDLSFGYNNSELTLRRTFQNGNHADRSLGKGWSFNYDTRIILGVKPRAEEETLFIGEKLDETKVKLQEALDLYNTSLTDIEEVLSIGTQIKNCLDSTILTLEELLSTAPVKFTGKIQDHLDHAIEKQDQIVLPFLVRTETAKSELLNARLFLESMERQKEELEDSFMQSEKELQMALARDTRNHLVWKETDPTHEKYTGNMTLTMIDGQGFPHLYRLKDFPDYESEVFYQDGSINYFPEGAPAIPVSVDDDQLEILPDGDYRLIWKNGEEWYYSFFGQLRLIRDRNGNELKFLYVKGVLKEIKDDFGRSILFAHSGGRIHSITAPNSACITYGYDEAGHLSSVTDPEGAVVRYSYDGPLMTAIIKPDGTRRRYQYVTCNGKPRVVKTVDEEGYTEEYRYDPQNNSGTYISPSGICETRYYNDRNLETRIEYGDGSSVFMDYNEQDNLIRRTNEEGETTHFSYDANRNLIERIHPDGSSEQWCYNSFNLPETYTDQLGRITDFTYDEAGNLIGVEYPDGTESTYRYNKRGQMIQSFDQLGKSTLYEYDDCGYLSSLTAADGSRRQFVNDQLGNILAAIDPLGNTIKYEYNLDNSPIRMTDPAGNSLLLEYDNRKDLVARIDKRGGRTEFEYDGRHLLTKIINPIGTITEYTYRGDGKLVEKNIDDCNHTTYDYDVRGNLTMQKQNETGSTITCEYDSAGRVIAMIDPNGNRTNYELDCRGRVHRIEDAKGNIHSFLYDPRGNRIEETDRLGRSINYSYDPLDRLTEIIDPFGNTEKYTYDNAGNLIEKTDKNDNTYAYQYDALGRITEITDPDGGTVRNGYDTRGLLVKRTDQRENTTRYEYDELGNLVCKINPLQGLRQYRYDPAGNLAARTDERGNSVAFEYDPVNRMVGKTDAYGNQTLYQYDAMGHIVGKTDALGNIWSYTYNGLGLLILETNPLDESKTYAYDPSGNLLQITDGKGRQNQFRYDSLNRKIDEINSVGDCISFEYDAVGNRTGEIDPSGIKYQYEYDKLNRPVKEVNRLGIIQTYEYDQIGNLIKKVDFKGNTTAFKYDSLNHLIAIHYSDGSDKSFRYDAAGNLTEAAGKETILTYAYDSLNRLISVKDSLTAKSISYSYDPAGNQLTTNLIESGYRSAYTYGKMNEVLSLCDADGRTTRFSYDPLLREVERIFPNNVHTETNYDAAGRITSIRNIRKSRGKTEKQLHSEAYLYNTAGERAFTIDGYGKVTAYIYDEAGRLAKILYPFCSGKPAADFHERLEMGLFPRFYAHDNAWGTEKSRSEYKGKSEKNTRFDLPLAARSGLDHDDLREKIGELLEGYKSLYPGTSTCLNKGLWHISSEEGATEFAAPLKLDAGDQEALQEAYKKITGSSTCFPQHRFNPRQRMWTETFEYDHQNNRICKSNGWGKIYYRYNPARELQAAGNRIYGYDANGNLTSEKIGNFAAVYSYNPENRIQEICRTLPSCCFCERENQHHISLKTKINYSYDALGRRIRKTVFRQCEGKGKSKQCVENSTAWLYDAQNFTILAELEVDLQQSENVKREKNRSRRTGSHPEGFTPQSEYLTVGGRILARILVDNSKTRKHRWGRSSKDIQFFHQDILGSTMMYSDCQGHEKMYFTYDAFGSFYSIRSLPWTPFRPQEKFFTSAKEKLTGDSSSIHLYNGKPYDPSAGFYNYGFRDYSPKLGRFTSPDPIRDSSNWYVYCGNDPVNRVDLFGLWEESIEEHIKENLRQDYKSGKNDCDIWVEERLDEAGIAKPDRWQPAISTTVAAHIKDLRDSLKETPDRGTNIVFHGGNHAMLLGLNEGGDVNIAHQSSNPGFSIQEDYKNVQEFEKDWSRYGEIRYLPLKDATSSEKKENR